MVFDPLGYYKILDADYNTDDTILKLNYREKAKFWHPDHNKSENALEEFQKISLAYDILHDKKSKAIYDLLSLVYDTSTFPDMKSLKIYKAVNGDETPFLRVFKLCRVTDVFKKPHITEENLIGTYSDAQKFINDITKKNWIHGWWTPKAFMLNIKALKNNYNNINNNAADNLAVLVHNALAYQQEHKYSEAYVCASQAWNYAAPYQKELLEKFLKSLPDVKTLPQPYWNYRRLQQVQLIVPSLLLAAILGFSVIGGMCIFHPAASDKLSYYQEVQHWRGGRGVDDVVVAKIMDIRVDLNSFNMLYHISPTTGVEVMYGPSDRFDVLTTLSQGHTVRVTGISPDKVWMRIMLDNGDMGFVHSADLVEGIGSPIPVNSQIYTGAR